MKQIDLVLLLTFWKNQQGLAHLASHCALTVGLHAHAITEIVTSQLDAELSLGSHFETNQTKNKKIALIGLHNWALIGNQKKMPDKVPKSQPYLHTTIWKREAESFGKESGKNRIFLT